MCDAVGFGFVVRGNAPVYVQTVDPNGPAAMAGLKVSFMYIVTYPSPCANHALGRPGRAKLAQL